MARESRVGRTRHPVPALIGAEMIDAREPIEEVSIEQLLRVNRMRQRFATGISKQVLAPCLRPWAGCVAAILFLGQIGCGKSSDSGLTSGSPEQLTIGVLVRNVQTGSGLPLGRFSGTSLRSATSDAPKRLLTAMPIPARARTDQNFITRKVDGIIVVPKRRQHIVSMIRRPTRQNIPIVY